MADLSDVIKRLEENNKKLAQLIAEKEKEDTLPDILKHAAPGVLAEKVYADKQIDKTKEHWKEEHKRDDQLRKQQREQHQEERLADKKQHSEERSEDVKFRDALGIMQEEEIEYGPDDIIINSAETSNEAAEKLSEASTQLAVVSDASMKEDATSDSKKKEDENERKNLLNKIAAGISNVGNYFKNQGKAIATAAKKGLGAILKGTFLGGVYLALLAFVNSEYWPKFIDILANAAEYITEKLIPYIQYIRNNIKKMGEAFSAIADFLGLTNTELAVYGLGGMFAFKIISIVLRIGRTLLKVGKFITSGIITPLVNVTKLALLKSWKAIKGIGEVFKSVRLFMMSNIINPMKIALKNAYMKGWNIIKTLPSTLRLMRIFMMTNILNPLTASSTATGAKKWAFMSKITNAIKALRVFFLASFLPMIAGFMTPFMPIILIGAGIALVLYALYEAFQDFKDTLDRTGSIGEAIKVAIGKFVGVLLGAIPALFLKLVAFVADLFGFKEFAKKIGDIDPIQWIADTVTGLIDNVVDFFKLLFDFDFGAWAKSLLPNWAKRWLGFSDEPEPVTPEQKKMQREAEIKELAKRSARLKATRGVGKEGKRLQAEALAEAKELDEKIKKLKESGEADVQKAIEKGYQGDIAQVEDLSEAEKKAFKAQQTEKTKKQKDYEGVVKDVVKKTAQQAAEGSTITNLAAGFGPTSFVATPESPVALKNQQKTSTMQEQAAARAARMGISVPRNVAQISDSSTKVVDNSSTSTSINTRTLGNPDPIFGFVANSR